MKTFGLAQNFSPPKQFDLPLTALENLKFKGNDIITMPKYPRLHRLIAYFVWPTVQKQQFLTSEKLEPENIWHFRLINVETFYFSKALEDPPSQ